MGYEFDAATAVTRSFGTNDIGNGAGVTYGAEIHDGWDIGGVANGGYVLAIVGRAVADFTGRPPLSITAHYLRPGQSGPCTVVVERVRAGKRMATATASLRQGDEELVRAIATCGTGTDEPTLLEDGGPPELPPYDECATMPLPSEPPFPGLNERLATRLRPGDERFRTGDPHGRAEIVGWFAFADGAPIDEIGLLLAADAFAPPVFNLGLGPPSWVPTLELTVHVRARPAPGPLRARFHTRFISNGLLSEDGELWDAEDRLVVESRQLALTPR